MFWNWRGGSAEPSRPVSSFCSFYKKSKNNSSNFLKNIKYKGFSTQDNLDLDKGLDTVVQSKKFRMTKRKLNNHEENFVIFTTTWILLGQFENTEYGLCGIPSKIRAAPRARIWQAESLLCSGSPLDARTLCWYWTNSRGERALNQTYACSQHSLLSLEIIDKQWK